MAPPLPHSKVASWSARALHRVGPDSRALPARVRALAAHAVRYVERPGVEKADTPQGSRGPFRDKRGFHRHFPLLPTPSGVCWCDPPLPRSGSLLTPTEYHVPVLSWLTNGSTTPTRILELVSCTCNSSEHTQMRSRSVANSPGSPTRGVNMAHRSAGYG